MSLLPQNPPSSACRTAPGRHPRTPTVAPGRTAVRIPVTLRILLPGLLFPVAMSAASPSLFEADADVGTVKHAGQVQWDATRQEFRVRGSGANMWLDRDAFRFAWKRMTGDTRLTATIRWPQAAGHPHRKACLLIRQGLEPDAAGAYAALHADGLISLQFRQERGGRTQEIQANLTNAPTLRVERCGETLWMSLAQPGAPLQPSGGSVRIRLTDPVFVGIGVCSHDDNAVAEAVFSEVQIESPPHVPAERPGVESTLETVAISSGDRRAVHVERALFEAPNWSRDGTQFFYNQEGRIRRIPARGGQPQRLDTGFATRCNNDHGLSPDGNLLALSDQTETGKSLIYIVPTTGGTPRRITPLGPSYWHGWSPDGATLSYCAERAGEYDIYTLPLAGGAEQRLTDSAGLDDGPDYSPDGRFIYFNSERNGRMQIWRMKADGTDQKPLTEDGMNDWFPHPSPDGKWLVFLSYDARVKGHPANKDVVLRLMPAEGGAPRVLVRLFGGQGTINVPSWSPDSRQLAFVSYRLIHHP